MAVTRDKDDIVLLCDLRLNSGRNRTVEKEVKNICFNLGYNAYLNSVLSSRGVGILFKRTLNYTVHRAEYDEVSNNFILLDVTIDNVRMTVGSVYGPNHDDEISFFDRLMDGVSFFNNESVLLGGDWNATWDDSKVEKNIDTLNMVALPRFKRTKAIIKLAEQLNLTDPFRIFYPTRRDFTFTPTSALQLNRSRIDFFLMSLSLSPYCRNCTIPNSTTGSIFDHKQISLTFKSNKGSGNKILKDHIFEGNDSDAYVRARVYESYLQHAITNNLFTEARKF